MSVFQMPMIRQLTSDSPIKTWMRKVTKVSSSPPLYLSTRTVTSPHVCWLTVRATESKSWAQTSLLDQPRRTLKQWASWRCFKSSLTVPTSTDSTLSSHLTSKCLVSRFVCGVLCYLHLVAMHLSHVIDQGTTRQNEPTIFVPSGVHHPKPNPKKKLRLGLGLGLGFGLVCTPLGKNIVGSVFWSYLLLLVHSVQCMLKIMAGVEICSIWL